MKQTGFTLIEMMVVVVIVAIIAAIALPSYREYVRRQRLAVAQQEMQTLAGELERYKGKNFSYKDFDKADIAHIYPDFSDTATLQIPVDKANKTYTITLVDADSKLPLTDSSSNGLNWAIIAVREPANPRNYDVLLRSDGTRCKTKDDGKVDDGNYDSCGSNSETW